MPRAAFNTNCDVYHGPGTATPGVLKGTCPCRVVLQDGIDLHGTGAPFIAAWITMEEVEPRGGWTPVGAGWNAALGDTIAVPSGAIPQFFTVYSELIEWGEQDPYYRACVAELPRPESCHCGVGGGASCELAELVPLGEVIPYTIIGVPAQRWYRMELEPGTYHYTVDMIYGVVEVNVWFGDCEEGVALADGTLDCIEFVVPEGEGDVLITIADVDDDVLAVGSLTIAAGPCVHSSILLEDETGYVLLEDGASKVRME